MLGVVTFTMYPLPENAAEYCTTHHIAPQLNILQFIGDIRVDGLYAILQLVMNVVLFMPFGYMATRWWRMGWIKVVICGAFFSLFIELTQLTGVWGVYPCAYRQFDVDDLLTNTFGAVLGACVALITNKFKPVEVVDKDEINYHPGLLHRFVTYTIDIIIMLLCTYPISIICVLVFYQFSTPLGNGTYDFNGFILSPELFSTFTDVLIAIALFLLQWLFPMYHRGQTIGGLITHMSFETKKRTGYYRLGFFALRFAILLYLNILTKGASQYSAFVVVVMILVWLFCGKRMPWDFIPGEDMPKLDDDNNVVSIPADEVTTVNEVAPAQYSVTDYSNNTINNMSEYNK